MTKESWLRKDDENVVAVHCKAGKGRTGVMIACLLMWMKEVECGWDALEYYAVMRTFNYKGVTIPSQIRYVLYFELAMKRSLTKQIYLKNIPKISIKKIWVGPVPKVDLFGGCTPWVLVLNNGNEFKSKYTHELNTYKS
jgi:phosphatidylinositol-3,4,5-trisphosphate 3-phosphatase/dual-specificity protein phosphatase PTEN